MKKDQNQKRHSNSHTQEIRHSKSKTALKFKIQIQKDSKPQNHTHKQSTRDSLSQIMQILKKNSKTCKDARRKKTCTHTNSPTIVPHQFMAINHKNISRSTVSEFRQVTDWMERKHHEKKQQKDKT
jgi:hypothetical protein